MDLSAMPIATLGGAPGGAPFGLPGIPGGGENLVETIEVPDHTVGLVIGRGGEQISQIQAQSNCRVQMSPDSNGTTMRQCTLQGSKQSIERAKSLISEVISRAGNRPPPGRPFDNNGVTNMGGGGGRGQQVTQELLIPGPKCGLIIGKGGETIKTIQETAGVKMIMIQDSQESSGQPKPLRIIGDADKVENARRMVEEILQSRDDQPPMQQRFNQYGTMMGAMGGGGGGFGGGGGGGGPRSIGEVIVPRASVGMIIGKGGETIKRLAAETGAKIQFKPDEDPSTPDRCAVIQGTTEQIGKATQLISELVNKAGGGGVGGASEIFYMHVPSNKTGLVIGKGGETIKQICGESGAHVELSRDPPPNATEKVFIIKGSPYQIHHAQHIIRIKVGDVNPGTPVPPFHGPGGAQGVNDFGMGGGHGMSHGGPTGYGNGAAQFAGSNPNQAAQWNNAFGQQQGEHQQWAQYYGQPAQPNFPQQQAYTQYPTPGAGTAQPAAPQTTASSAPTINPQTGQPDYSAQWAEYYRSMGMHEQANLIDQQLKQNTVAAQPGAATAAASAGARNPQQFGGYGTQPAQTQFGYGAPQGQPQTGYQFQQQQY